MANTTNISIRMDSKLKADADALFESLGMNLSTAFNIFVRQCLREEGIPFEITVNHTPNSRDPKENGRVNLAGPPSNFVPIDFNR